jgi:hypothetical protein
MYAFQADFHSDQIYFEMAEDALKSDIALCRPDTPYREQGMGFLTVLYWKAGKLTEAMRQFALESGADPGDSHQIFDLSNVNTFNERGRPFILLHRLQVCALAARAGQPLSGLDSIKDFLFKECRLDRYPWVLCAKWAAILLAMAGREEDALAMLREAGPDGTPEDQFTIQLLRLPLKMVQHICRRRLTLRSGFHFGKELERLEQIVEGIGSKIEHLADGRFDGPVSEWDLYGAGILLPFNYS